MTLEHDNASDDDIRDLLREIRDCQRELVQLAKQDREILDKQREEWDEWHSKATANAPDWEAWEQSNREYIKYERSRWLFCTVVLTTTTILFLSLCITAIMRWLE